MRRRTIWLIIVLSTLAIGTVALVVFYLPHPADSVLIKNFNRHEADFNLLVKLANEDSKVFVISTSYVRLESKDSSSPSIYLDKDEAWPRSESELGFSKQRWDEYCRLFKKLNLDGVSRKRDVPDAIFFTASHDFPLFYQSVADETASTEKGFVYSDKGIHYSLTDSLDEVKVNRPTIYFMKLNDYWYLYYEWSVSKPE